MPTHPTPTGRGGHECPPQRVVPGGLEGHSSNKESVHHTLVFGFLKLRNFHDAVKGTQRRTAYGYVITPPQQCAETIPRKATGVCHTYRRGLLRCSFRLDWAMRRPCRAGRVTGTDSRAFFIYRYYNSDLTHKNRPVRESAEGHRLTRQAASTSCGFPSSIC